MLAPGLSGATGVRDVSLIPTYKVKLCLVSLLQSVIVGREGVNMQCTVYNAKVMELLYFLGSLFLFHQLQTHLVMANRRNILFSVQYVMSTNVPPVLSVSAFLYHAK